MKCRVRTQRQLDRVRSQSVKELSPVSIVAMLTVCIDKLHFGREKVRKAASEIDYSFDSITKDYVAFKDLKEDLLEQGVDIPFDFDHFQPCFTIDDAEKNTFYVEKAFACAVFCTVLMDKFLFGSVKTQQAVKQLCVLCDELKNDRNRLKDLEKMLLDKFEICINRERTNK